jgi:homospermidine synthase
LKASKWPVHGEITGPIVMIGFGSIGRGTLPLIERHFKFDKSRMVIIDPDDKDKAILDDRGIAFIKKSVTINNYRKLLKPLLTKGAGQGFCVNLSVDTSSLDIMRLCRELGVLYIDTVIEPWKGFYYDKNADNGARTNYALRQTVKKERKANPGGTTAVSCCGANPGMVSWFVKKALVELAGAIDPKLKEPKAGDRKGWATLMQSLGVKGVHIAERDTQRTVKPKPFGVFWNTWSVEGFISEGFQPAELGWGTHEKWKPKNAKGHKFGSKCGIYLEQPGATTQVRTWCPTEGAQHGLLVTHNEAISISDYYTVKTKEGNVAFRPTAHYAYHPCNSAVVSLDEMFGNAGTPQTKLHVLDNEEILDGADELGVLLYGHKKNAFWFGSTLNIDEARSLAPHQNATGLQVTSAVLAGMVWALENPEAGIVESDEMDYQRCLEIQTPYLGKLKGYYTDWTPLSGRPGLFKEDVDASDPWQFRNVLVH